MGKGRLEAFSDGVLTPLMPVFLAYVLSFVYVGSDMARAGSTNRAGHRSRCELKRRRAAESS